MLQARLFISQPPHTTSVRHYLILHLVGNCIMALSNDEKVRSEQNTRELGHQFAHAMGPNPVLLSNNESRKFFS